MCPACRQPVSQCGCARQRVLAPAGPVRVSRQTGGRAGKVVTLVQGLALDDAGLAALAKQLKATCGSGGTAKAGVIEIQGDHCDRVLAELLALGHRAKRSGG